MASICTKSFLRKEEVKLLDEQKSYFFLFCKQQLLKLKSLSCVEYLATVAVIIKLLFLSAAFCFSACCTLSMFHLPYNVPNNWEWVVDPMATRTSSFVVLIEAIFFASPGGWSQIATSMYTRCSLCLRT